VRGHSNVQGQRTVGISEKPELAPLDRLAEQYGFALPGIKGLNTVEASEAIVAGKIRAFTGLGVNFRSVPRTSRINQRMWQPGRFYRPIAAHKSKWQTATSANLVILHSSDEDEDTACDDHNVLKMITLRTRDQFIARVYGNDDHLRAINGTRMVAFLNANDTDRMRLREGEPITLATIANDEMKRERSGGLRVSGNNILRDAPVFTILKLRR
jgi:hypothetical protein